ncbi:MAG: NAD-dependent deacylase [Bacillota bacterium]|nr:NAD-dependent deacylase [Bacillota bacterium]
METGEKLKTLARLLREHQPAFALTGAGVSTESGIPDFRSRGEGLWERYDPAEVCSVEALHRDPARFWRFNLRWWRGCREAQPNAAHRALAALERAGLLRGVITQNIDGLHRAAGSTVWEVHGHLRTCRCMRCDRRHDFACLLEQIDDGADVPRCPCGGMLRPDVVLFGDAMGKDYWRATQVLTGCQMLLVVGSSLQVYPVAGLPRLARRLAIVNREPTPYDEEAAVVIHRAAGETLRSLLAELEMEDAGP